MLIYLDMCCLKRPFDDQAQARIRLESEAVLGLLAAESDAIQFVRSRALMLENACNLVRRRASRVEQWLVGGPVWHPDVVGLQARTAELVQVGFKNFDALHVASAELSGADVVGTCDDRLLAVARRNAARLRVRVLDIIELTAEVLK